METKKTRSASCANVESVKYGRDPTMARPGVYLMLAVLCACALVSRAAPASRDLFDGEEEKRGGVAASMLGGGFHQSLYEGKRGGVSKNMLGGGFHQSLYEGKRGGVSRNMAGNGFHSSIHPMSQRGLPPMAFKRVPQTDRQVDRTDRDYFGSILAPGGRPSGHSRPNQWNNYGYNYNSYGGGPYGHHSTYGSYYYADPYGHDDDELYYYQYDDDYFYDDDDDVSTDGDEERETRWPKSHITSGSPHLPKSRSRRDLKRDSTESHAKHMERSHGRVDRDYFGSIFGNSNDGGFHHNGNIYDGNFDFMGQGDPYENSPYYGGVYNYDYKAKRAAEIADSPRTGQAVATRTTKMQSKGSLEKKRAPTMTGNEEAKRDTQKLNTEKSQFKKKAPTLMDSAFFNAFKRYLDDSSIFTDGDEE